MDQITNYGPNRPILGAFYAVMGNVGGKECPVAVFPVLSEARKAARLFGLGGVYEVPVLDLGTQAHLDHARGVLAKCRRR